MTLEKIKKIVEVVTGYSLRVRSRKREYVCARNIYYALAKEFYVAENYTRYGYNFSEVGKAVGTDHSTINNQVKKFSVDILGNLEWRTKYDQCRYYVLTGERAEPISPMKDMMDVYKQNQALKKKISGMATLEANTARLMALYNALPNRLQEDVIFKVEVAHKLNEKHKRDLTVIYTEG